MNTDANNDPEAAQAAHLNPQNNPLDLPESHTRHLRGFFYLVLVTALTATLNVTRVYWVLLVSVFSSLILAVIAINRIWSGRYDAKEGYRQMWKIERWLFTIWAVAAALLWLRFR